MQWCGVLFVLFGACQGGRLETTLRLPIGRMDNVPRVANLPSPEQNVMPYQPVIYSSANISTAYRSSTKYNAKGMGHLYFITNKFLNFLLKEQAYPEGWLRVSDSGHVEKVGSWAGLAWHWRGLVLLVGAGLALAGAVPLVGLVFCCCRCAGRCGARTQPFDSRYDTCRRHILGALLSCFTVLIMFGVVCSFVTNEQMEDGSRKLPKSINAVFYDSDLYLNNTKMEVNSLLVTNFNELESVLDKLLHRSGEIVKDRLGDISKATVLANLTTIVSGLKQIRSDLNNIDSLTRQLQDNAVTLEIALREVRMSLLAKLETCRSERACIEFLNRYNITALSLEANFTQLLDRYLPQLPDVTTSLQNVSALLADNIEDEVLKGKDQFDRIKYNIQTSVDRRIPEISREIHKAGELLKEKNDNINKLLGRLQDALHNVSSRPVDELDDFYKQYLHYRYYLGVGVSGCLLAILILLCCGLLCGYCGHRPGSGADECCDKGTASNSLMLAFWLMVLSFSALTLVLLAYAVTGSVNDRAVCTVLRNPASSHPAALLDSLIDISQFTGSRPATPLSTVVQECHRNSSVYKVLGLEMGSVTADYQSARLDIPRRVKQLADSIVLTSDIRIITPLAEKQLKALAASPLNGIELTAYTSVLNDKITSIDLLQMAAALNQTAVRLPPSQSQVKTVLLTQAMYLEVHQERQVATMARLVGWLHGNATALSSHLRFNHSSLALAIDSLLKAVFSAQRMLNERGPAIVHELAEEFGKEFSKHIDTYLERVENEAQKNVGRCWPLSQAYNATIVSACNSILDPFNGFWVSSGWVVLLFLPVCVLCVKLSSLYQKSDPYPGPLVEAEYLYDAYHHQHAPVDRDNIPLASVDKKKRRKKKSGGNAGVSRYDTSVNYSAHLSRSTDGRGLGSVTQPTPQEREWGGLPRYEGAEFERPPPYYFPPGSSPTAQ